MADRLGTVATTDPQRRRLGEVRRNEGTQPVYGPHQRIESINDQLDSNLQARLYEESVGYPNRAGEKLVRERARAAVMGCIEQTHNVLEFLRNKWLVLYRLYRGETLAQWTYGRMPLHSPEPFKIVETLHPRVMRALFGSEPWFKLYGLDDHDDPAARRQEALCRHQFREMDYIQRASRFVRNGLIYGTAVQKCFWKQEIRDVAYRSAVREPDPRMPGTQRLAVKKVERRELVFDGNMVEEVPIFDVFGPPTASSGQDAEWLADRSLWPFFRIREMGQQGHWLNLSELKDEPGDDGSSHDDEHKERKAYSYGIYDAHEAKVSPHVGHLQVIDWWGPLDIDGNGQEVPCNVVLIDPQRRKLPVRVTRNPYWHGQKPYQVWRWTDLTEELFGIGSIEMVARLSVEKDTKRMLSMSATQIAANPMLAVSDEANIADDQLVASPGRILRVPGDPRTSIMPVHVPQVSDAAVKAENLLTMDIRETAGTTSPLMGSQSPVGSSSDTATQHMSEVDQAQQRLTGPIGNFEREVLTPLLHQMTWNNQQFLSYPKTIHDVAPQSLRQQDRYTVGPEQILGRFLVVPLVGFKMSTKVTMTQQMMNLLDRAMVINQVYGPNTIKVPKLFGRTMELGFDFRDVEDFVAMPSEDSNLLTALEEHEFWYHGKVPPVRADDNQLRHMIAHMEEIQSERFAELERTNPSVAHRARAHAAEHGRRIAMLQEQQENALMLAQQAQLMQAAAGGGGGRGAAGPGQDPSSPSFRRSETADNASDSGPKESGTPESDGAATRSQAGSQAPKTGSQ